MKMNAGNRYLRMVFILLALLFLVTFLKEVQKKERLRGPLAVRDVNLLAYMKKHFLKPPSSEPYPDFLFKFKFAQTMRTMFLDEIIRKVFEDEPPGFFLEAGALDGVRNSNTLWLESNKFWTGLLIEPKPSNYLALLKANRKAWTSQSCISTSPYPKSVIMIGFNPERKSFTNLLAVEQRWLQQSLTYESEVGENYHGHLPQTYDPAQCFPLASFLYSLNVTEVDFLSLDIQGGEWEVLKMFPWSTVKLRSFAVEYLNTKSETNVVNKEFINYFKLKGYAFLGISHLNYDYFFVKLNDTLYEKYDRKYIQDQLV